jgi:hypothetical protein
MDLFYSLQLLFEKRLGWELYRPIGMEWWDEGYWSVYPHPDTAAQFLSTSQSVNIPKDVHGFQLPQRLRHNENYHYDDGIYYVVDPSKGMVNRGITLQRFKDTKFDIVLSSIPQHIPMYNKLIQNFQPQAKHIFQVGNCWGRQPGVSNILASTTPFAVPAEINACFYHQEFDLETFHQAPAREEKKIFSFIHYMREVDLYNAYRAALPGFIFCSHGAGMERDLCVSVEIAARIRESMFVWHIKPEGDGYGHILHNAYATGRPAIIKGSHYRGKLGETLLSNGSTCIDIENLPVAAGAAEILRASQPDRYSAMSENAYNRFRSVVDFDAEEQRIRQFLGQLR